MFRFWFQEHVRKPDETQLYALTVLRKKWDELVSVKGEIAMFRYKCLNTENKYVNK